MISALPLHLNGGIVSARKLRAPTVAGVTTFSSFFQYISSPASRMGIRYY